MAVTPHITDAAAADAAAMAEIYAHHVLHGTATFETAPPDAAGMADRLARVQRAAWPWLVARDASGAVVGYAYVMQFRDRPAYRFSCEDSVYVRHDRRGEGIGAALLSALIPAAEACGFRQMFAVIGGAEPASIALHARLGFVEAGRMRGIGRKFGRWLDTVYMQRALGPGARTSPPREPD